MTMSRKTYSMYVGGKWVKSSSGETVEEIDPATDEVIADIQRATREDADAAVACGRKAYDTIWFDTPPKERASMMLALANPMMHERV